MEPVQNTPNQDWDRVKAGSSKKTPITIGGIVLLILLLAGGAYLYRNGYNLQVGNVKLGETQPSPTTVGTEETIIDYEKDYAEFKRKLENCEITSKEGNPLINSITTVGDTIVGTLFGTTGEIVHSTNQSAVVEFVSPRADQLVKLDIKEDPYLITDAVKLTNLKLKDLKKGQTVTVSFNCFPQNKTDKFKVSGIAVTNNPYAR